MDDLLAGDGDAIALVEASSGRRVTYGEMRAAIAEGERVPLTFLFARNDVATVIALYRAIARGEAIAMFDAKLEEARAAALIERYRPERIVGREAKAGEGG